MSAPAPSIGTAPRASDPSLADLRHRLAQLEGRVRELVGARRAGDTEPDDRFRGLYLSDAHVDRLLAVDPRGAEPLAGNGHGPSREDQGLTREGDGPTRAAGEGTDAVAAALPGPSPSAALPELRLPRLARDFGLEDDDVAILLVGLAPDIDRRFEQLYAYLQDDVTRRRPSIGLALEVCGRSGWATEARRRLLAGSALVDGGLIRIEEADRPFLTRPIRVPDRVVAHVLGDDTPDEGFRHLLPDAEQVGAPAADRTPLPEFEPLAAALSAGVGLVYLRDRVGSAAVSAACLGLRRIGHGALVLDLDRLSEGDDARELLALAARDARLHGAGIVAGPIEALARAARTAVSCLADAPLPVVLFGRSAWEAGWSRRVPWVVDAPILSSSARRELWTALASVDLDAAMSLRLAAYRLAPEQIARAVRSARVRADAEGREPALGDLQAGARAENASGLDRLARRVEPRASWSDLVLPETVRAQLRELAARARRRDIVIDDWGMGGGASHGRGVTALFAGDPGTGKTMSAEVIAAELGLDLYVIDLSSVVDKYIGETEKNLDRIFSEADRINGVLLFDEADALFGQRSEVRDARDRYANVEIAYLLQRMEQFDGLAILTTNLRANIDAAFLRRLDAVVDFPMPEEDDRLAIWRLHLPPRVPLAEDVDLGFMAARFRLSGGHIRNVCLTAAYLAAERDGRVAMADVVRATEREYGKLGRLTVEAEFGPYLALLAGRRGVSER